MAWFHTVCVKESITNTLYTCTNCCTIASNVSNIVLGMGALMTKVEKISRNIGEMNESHMNLASKMQDIQRDNDRTKQDNIILRNELVQLRAELQEKKWANLQTGRPKNVLVVGSSVLRDIDNTKIENTTVHNLSGGKIKDAKDVIHNIPARQYSEIALVIGGSDCEDTTTTVKDIVEEYKGLLSVAKEKAENVIVGSILPRICPHDEDTAHRINAVNAEIEVVCEEYSLKYVDNNVSFRLQDGTVNNGYYLKERNTEKQVYLTNKGTSKLCQNMNIKAKTGMQVTKDRHYQPQSGIRSSNFQHNQTTTNRPNTASWSDRRDHFSSGMEPQTIVNMQWARGHPTSRQPPMQEQQSSHAVSSAPYYPNNTTGTNYTTHDRNMWDRNSNGQPNRGNRDVYCYNCGERGHMQRMCWYLEELNCRYCSEPGHKEKYCRYATQGGHY
jgi:hypothetical protein